MHPYEIATTLRDQHHDSAVKLNYGSLYSVIDSMRRVGWVEVQGTDRQGNRPERTVYAITDAGRSELTRWLRELLSTPAKEYPLFSAGLTFITALPPDEVMAQLALRVHRLETEVQQARAALQAAVEGTAESPAVPRVFLIEDEYQLTLKESELAWVRGLLQEMNTGSLPGMDDWRRYHEEPADSEDQRATG